MTNSYHTVICSVTRGLVEGPGRQCTPCVTLPTNPAPSYHSVRGYTNGTVHFGDRDGTTMSSDQQEGDSSLHFGDRDGFDSRKDGTTRKDGAERSTLPFDARDGSEDDVTFWHHRWFDSEKEGDPSGNIVGPTRGEGEGGPDLRSTGSG